MATNLDKLLTTAPTQIIAELEDLRSERTAIERKEVMLSQVIELMFQEGGEAAEALAGYRTALPVGPLRYQIRQVLLAGTQGEPWLPMEVHDELHVRGNATVTLPNVRMTMKRMTDRGELIEDPDNELVYRLPVPAEGWDPQG